MNEDDIRPWPSLDTVYMRRRISIRGCVRASVRPSVRPSVCPVLFSKVKTTHTRRILCRVSSVLLALFNSLLLHPSGRQKYCQSLFLVVSIPSNFPLSLHLSHHSFPQAMRSGEIPNLGKNRSHPSTSTLYVGGKFFCLVEVCPPFQVSIDPETGRASSGRFDDLDGKIEVNACDCMFGCVLILFVCSFVCLFVCLFVCMCV